MKEPIKPEDIRKGDLIRCEYVERIGMSVAEEYISPEDGHGSGYNAKYYLLDRPLSRDERAAWYLAHTLAGIRKRATGEETWFKVDHAREVISILREWEAKNE